MAQGLAEHPANLFGREGRGTNGSRLGLDEFPGGRFVEDFEE
jgi:hypothetical protein